MFKRTSQFYNNHKLTRYLKRQTTELSLQSLCKYGNHLTEKKLMDMSNFVKEEISVRLAKRINDFQSLPFVTVNSSHLQDVYDLYWESFLMFSTFPIIHSMRNHDEFLNMMKTNLRNHLVVIPKISMGIHEAGKTTDATLLNSFTHRILRSRISRRVLAQQLLSLTEQYKLKGHCPNEIYTMKTANGDIGIVSTQLDIKETLMEMYDATSKILKKHYERIPEIEISGQHSIKMMAIKEHLQYILLEILKNALEATVKWNTLGYVNKKWFNKHPTNLLPKLRVTLVENEFNTCIRLSDRGGGIDNQTLSTMFDFTKQEAKLKSKKFEKLKYFAGTTHEQLQEDAIQNLDVNKDKAEHLHEIQEKILKEFLVASTNKNKPYHSPIHLGLGLPMSKVFLDYWNSEILIQSVDGFGTDVYLTINKVIHV